VHISSNRNRSKSTEKRIREAALHLFARKGFEGTSIRDIASEADLSISALYYYVETKEELLITIIQDTMQVLFNSALSIKTTRDLPERKLAQLVLLHSWFHGDRSLETQVVNTEYRFLTGEAHQKALDLRDRYEAIWREIVFQGKSEGVFQIQNTKLTAIALIEMSRAITHWYKPSGELTLAQICLMYVDLALGLVRAVRDGKPVYAADLNLVEPQQLIVEAVPTNRAVLHNISD
jgi:AcrR family transcriptional regulator